VRASSAHDLSIGYAELSLRLAVLTVTPGFALVLAGAVCLMHRPAGVIGPVVGLLAVAWLSSTWIGWHAAPSVSRSAAELVAPFLVPALFHVAVVAGGRSPTRTERWVVGALYAGTAAGSVLLALSREPYTDQSCWANCTTNVFLVQSHPSLAHVVVNAERALELSGCVALVAVAIARGLSGAARSRGESAVVVLPAAVVAVAEAARIVQIHRLGHEDPLDRGLQLSFTVAAAGLAVLAAGLVASVVRATRTRAAIDRAMTEFGGAPRAGSVEQALRAALGDGSLQIAYRMPGAEGYVDEAGHILALPAASVGRPLTNVTRQGEVIAAILCERETAEHLRTLRGALVLGLENERLQASVLARLEDLRSSRARIVAASDEARSRLERDLHDGAQQHLLALSFDLRLALAAAQRGGDDEAARHVGQALSLTERALSELRDLARPSSPSRAAQPWPSSWTCERRAPGCHRPSPTPGTSRPGSHWTTRRHGGQRRRRSPPRWPTTS
jgi:signal transduction histidine kinase